MVIDAKVGLFYNKMIWSDGFLTILFFPFDPFHSNITISNIIYIHIRIHGNAFKWYGSKKVSRKNFGMISVGDRHVTRNAKTNKTVFRGVFFVRKYQIDAPAKAII